MFFYDSIEILEVLQYDKFKDSMNLEKVLNEAGDEAGNDLALVTGSTKNTKDSEEQVSSDGDALSDDEFGDAGSDSEEDASNDEDGCDNSEAGEFDSNHSDTSDEEHGAAGEHADEFDSNSESGCEAEPASKKPKLKEDIYGRLRDEKGNIVEVR